MSPVDADFSSLDAIAETLHQAAASGGLVGQPSLSQSAISIEDAYAVQRKNIAHREKAGSPIVGYKMGLTSKAKMEQMGVPHPIYGVLTKDMLLSPGDEIPQGVLPQPRIEPEIAFVLGSALKGEVTMQEAMAAVKTVHCALEVINSRYANFKFSLEDVVADNASSSFFAISDKGVAPNSLDLSNLGMVMSKDGEVAEVGSSSAILENPMRSLVELCTMMAKSGQQLPAGSVVLAGAATKAIPFTAGAWVKLEVDGLGSVDIRMAS